MTRNGLGRPGLLVSVRSAAEAVAALDGGADLIDVKEPARGPLGAPDPEVVERVVAAIGGRTPVSVALGEWAERGSTPPPAGVAFVKWGLARLGEDASAIERIRHFPMAAAPVLVAYADHPRAESPDPEELARVACRLQFPAFLIDTAVKDGSTLLDWLPLPALSRIRVRLAEFGVQVALAGSLDARRIRELAGLAPDWFAVRGAACVGGRSGIVCPDRVRQLQAVIGGDWNRAGGG